MKPGYKKFLIGIARFFLYILGKALIVAVAVVLVFFAFRTAENSSQVYFMAKDAFSLRTSVILTPLNNDDTDLLPGLFTEEYLRKSSLDTQTTNSSYTVTSYDQRTDVTITVIFAWQDHAKVQVKNVVQDISAKVSSSVLEVNEVDQFIESGIYSLYVVKDEDGSWKVEDIVLEEEITPESVYPIPTVTGESDSGIIDESVMDMEPTE